jgi:hypothetical protein
VRGDADPAAARSSTVSFSASWARALVDATERGDPSETAALIPSSARDAKDVLAGGTFMLDGSDGEQRLLGVQLLTNWLRERGELQAAVMLSKALLRKILSRTEKPVAQHVALQINNVAGLFASIASDAGRPAEQLALWPEVEADLRRLGLHETIIALAVAKADLFRMTGHYERADRLLRRLGQAKLLPGDALALQRLVMLRQEFLRRPDEAQETLPQGTAASIPEALIRPPETTEEETVSRIARAREDAAALPGARNPWLAVSDLSELLGKFGWCHDPAILRALVPSVQALVTFCTALGFTREEETARWLESVFLRRIGALDEAAATLRVLRGTMETRRQRIDDPHLRAAAGLSLTHLYPVSADVLRQLGRFEEMFEAIEEAKSRVLADLIASSQAPRLLDPWSPRPRVACKAEALLGEIRVLLKASRRRAHYLTLLTDDLCSYAVLVDADGRTHGWEIALGRPALLAAVRDLEILVRGSRSAFPRPKRGILSAPMDAGRWPFEPVLHGLAPLLAPLSDLFAKGTIKQGELLCISPDGVGFGLPWPALPLAGASLIDRLTPVLVPSARTLLAAFEQSILEDPRNGGADVVLAPHGGEGKIALDGFERDGALLGTLIPTVIHRKEAASVRALERLDLRGGVVHFAAHGEFRPTSPLEESGIELPGWDGALPVTEKGRAECRLNSVRAARLKVAGSHVTLRACVSGSVAEIAGRESLGMVYGLWQAGVQSMLAGQWDLNLPSSAVLVDAFYCAWLGEGMSRSDAYAAAIKAVRDTGEAAWAHPYHWAGLALWGWWD